MSINPETASWLAVLLSDKIKLKLENLSHTEQTVVSGGK